MSNISFPTSFQPSLSVACPIPATAAPVVRTPAVIGAAMAAVGGNTEAAINAPEAIGFTIHLISSQNPGP